MTTQSKAKTQTRRMTSTERATLNSAIELTQSIEQNTQLLLNARPNFQRGNTTAARDINAEAGYPKDLKAVDYQDMYDSEGHTARVVDLWPDECWQKEPEIFETEDATEQTDFEAMVEWLVDKHQLFDLLCRMDKLSGVGRFGIMVLGFNDGGELSDEIPVTFNEDESKWQPADSIERKLMWATPYSEAQVTIKKTEDDQTSPRYGMPVSYLVKMDIPSEHEPNKIDEIEVHWTRAWHLVDNKTSSNVFGIPRLKKYTNRLYDILKIAAGSGEGYWAAATPAIFLGSDKPLPAGSIDKVELREQMFKLRNSLQKYLAVAGMEATVLAPKMNDPGPYLDVHITLMCIGIGVPKRVFMGTEEAKLAGEQDASAWGRRVHKRRVGHVTNNVILGFFNHLQMVGACPLPGDDGVNVAWPEPSAETELDRVEVAKKWVEAIVSYMNGGIASLIPEKFFLSTIMGLTSEEIEQIMEEVEETLRTLEGEISKEDLAAGPDSDEQQPPDPNDPAASGEDMLSEGEQGVAE
jgi:hypothetical protein